MNNSEGTSPGLNDWYSISDKYKGIVSATISFQPTSLSNNWLPAAPTLAKL
jgi:hypothetical protein